MGVTEGPACSYKKYKMTGTAILKSMIPLKVQTPLPSYRTGTVSAGGTHQGKKKKKENLTTHPLKLVHQSPKGIITEKSFNTYVCTFNDLVFLFSRLVRSCAIDIGLALILSLRLLSLESPV